MTIRELLEIDWTIAEIDVTVRDTKGYYTMGYVIGKDVKPGRTMRFMYETKAGDVYEYGRVADNCMKKLFIRKIIQYKQLDKKTPGKEACVGVLTKEIPKEIINLEIDHMAPYGYGHSDGMHGYYITCEHPMWLGILGENEVVEQCE